MSRISFAKDRFFQKPAITFFALAVVATLNNSSYAGQSNSYVRLKSTILKPSDDFNFYAYHKRQRKNEKPALAFSNSRDPVKWQATARARLKSLLKLPTGAASPLLPKLGDKVHCTVGIGNVLHKYTRQEILFYSRKDFPVSGYLLLPEEKKAKATYPAVICLPGHASRAEDIVGLHPDGTTRTSLWKEYQHDLAVQCVTNGYATLAIDLIAIGARAPAKLRKEFPQGNACNRYSHILQLYGENVMGYRVYDVIRAIDYMQSRNDIDKSKIATMGISGGAAVSLLTAAVEPRIKCAVVSCFCNEIDQSLVAFEHCACQYIPDLAKTFRISDIAGLVAPRLLILEASENDVGFPLKGALSAFAETKKIFTALKSPQNVILFQTKGDHEFDGRDAFKKMNSALK